MKWIPHRPRTSRPLAAVAVVASLLLGTGCGGAAPRPATLDRAHDACGSCRMVVSDPRMAIQVVAPLEEPRFFDDFGCVARYVQAAPLPAGGTVYVSDHWTQAWIRADQAIYSRVSGFSAPMGSHVMAHESEASRQADPAAAGGVVIAAREVFPASVLRVSGGAR